MKTIAETPIPSGPAILERTIALSLCLHGISAQRKADMNGIETDADKDLLRLSKRILQCPELAALRKADTAIKAWLVERSLPSPFREGIYLLPVGLLAEIDARLEAYIATERPALVEALLDVYPKYQGLDQLKLGTLYDAHNYPSATRLRRAFRVTSAYLTLSVPGQLADVSAHAHAKAQARAEALWAEAGQEIRAALREATAQLVRRMVARLTDDADGRQRRLHASSWEKAKEFLSLFHHRDLTKDGALAELVARAQALLEGHDVDDVREDETLRTEIRVGFEALEREAAALVEAVPSRRILLEEAGA